MNNQFPVIYLFSFGYRYSGPPEDTSGHGGGFVFDCRGLPNPHWDANLRPHHGWEPPVMAFMEGQPEALRYAESAQAMVLQMAGSYREKGYERLMVSFGCTGGRHRSVWQAEKMREALERAGFRVQLSHVDRERPPDPPHRKLYR